MIEGFAINYVRGIGYDETVDAHSCAASVRFNGNDTGEYATDITFDVHTDATDPSSFVVQVYGLDVDALADVYSIDPTNLPTGLLQSIVAVGQLNNEIDGVTVETYVTKAAKFLSECRWANVNPYEFECRGRGRSGGFVQFSFAWREGEEKALMRLYDVATGAESNLMGAVYLSSLILETES